MQYHVVSELFTNNFSILFVETKQKKLEERKKSIFIENKTSRSVYLKIFFRTC